MILNPKEQAFIRYLARCFLDNRRDMTRVSACEENGLEASEYDVLIRSMESLGAVENILTASGQNSYAFHFQTTYTAVELVREIDATHATQADFVEQIQKRFKRSPVAAGVILFVLVLAILSPIYGSVMDILERIGWIGAPSSSVRFVAPNEIEEQP